MMKKVSFTIIALIGIFTSGCVIDVSGLVKTPSTGSSSENKTATASPQQQPSSSTSVQIKPVRWTEGQMETFLTDCKTTASRNPSISSTAINTYCECTGKNFDQMYDYVALSLGSVDLNQAKTVIQSCGLQAGVNIQLPSESTGSGSNSGSSSDQAWCNESYENQLVCSGVPAAALPHVPW